MLSFSRVEPGSDRGLSECHGPGLPVDLTAVRARGLTIAPSCFGTLPMRGR